MSTPLFIRTLGVLLFYIVCHIQVAYAQPSYWIQKGGSSTIDEAMDVAIDAAGNTYTVGYYNGVATFGATSLTSAGANDIFLFKTNNQGDIQWAVSAGGSQPDRGLAVCVDDNGNPYITGFYNGTATFDTTSITALGEQDVFIAKYTTNGVFEWVESAGSTEADIGNGIAFDHHQSIVVTGEFKDTASFGGNTLISPTVDSDVFTAKIHSSGSWVWVEQGSGSSTDRGVDVDCDPNGNVYITGLFSGNITFDVTHNNNILNAIFTVKYDSNGAEQWFRYIGAGTSNTTTGITVDQNGAVYTTGDFTGTPTVFNTTNTTFSGLYDNGVFIVKYSALGATQWSTTRSSDANVHVRDICVDANLNTYIVGDFECAFDDFRDHYGDAIFNSVGFTDVYVARFDVNGAFDYAHQFGSREDDLGRGIAIIQENQPIAAGSFEETFRLPTSSNFNASNLSNWQSMGCAANNGYCGDASYGDFHGMATSGQGDAFVVNAFDTNRSPFDYFERSGSACVLDQLPVCLNAGCPDTVEYCDQFSLNIVDQWCDEIAPTKQWSYFNPNFFNNQAPPQNSMAQTGFHTIGMRSLDECFVYHDSAYIIRHISPTTPLISDSKGFNNNSINPAPIQTCNPDTVDIMLSNVGPTTFTWSSATPFIGGSQDTLITVTQEGFFQLDITDTITGCVNTKNVSVLFYDTLAPFHLAALYDDTVSQCTNVPYTMWLSDSLAKPGGSTSCFSYPNLNLGVSFTMSPLISANIACNTSLEVTPTDTGWVDFSAMVTRFNVCDTDTQVIFWSVYFIPIPAPELGPASLSFTAGSNFYCPGDSVLLAVTGSENYSWTGPFTGTVNYDSIYASVEGAYSLSSFITDTNSFGCFTTLNLTDQVNVYEKPQPEISAVNSIICPNDSVMIICNTLPNPINYTGLTPWKFPATGAPYFEWYGPNGLIPDTTQNIWVDDPGDYFVIVYDSDSCALTSNTITLTEYTTPFLFTPADLFLCDNDSVEISVISTPGSIIEWLAPLNTNQPSIFIDSAGTYYCKISACGIETNDSVEVLNAPANAQVFGDTFFCPGDSVILSATLGMTTYNWSIGGDSSSIMVDQPGSLTLTVTDSTGCIRTSPLVTVSSSKDSAFITTIEDSVLCAGDTMTLFGSPNRLSYTWLPSLQTTRDLIIQSDGNYQLITEDSNNCLDTSVILSVYMPDSVSSIITSGPTSFCEGDSVVLSSESTAARYQWSPTNDSTRNILVTSAGQYTLTTTDEFGCDATSALVEVLVQAKFIDSTISLDTTICKEEQVAFELPASFGNWTWYDFPDLDIINQGVSYNTGPLDTTTRYIIQWESGFCTGDTQGIRVTVIDCGSLLAPNVFTPNGDGQNDVFRISLTGITCLDMAIYNRWGQQVAQLSHPNQSWDGTMMATGEMLPEGQYYYQAEYCLFNGERATVNGSLTMLRN